MGNAREVNKSMKGLDKRQDMGLNNWKYSEKRHAKDTVAQEGTMVVPTTLSLLACTNMLQPRVSVGRYRRCYVMDSYNINEYSTKNDHTCFIRRDILTI
jgi:hypothetical protein